MRLAQLRRIQETKPEQAISYLAMSIRRFLRDNSHWAYSFDDIKLEFELEDKDDALLRASLGYLIEREYIRFKDGTRSHFEFKR